MAEKVKSGKEILDEFFASLNEIEDVDNDIADMLSELYSNDKLTDVNVKNELQKLREKDVNKD
jgi:flagellin-specific chaperone FliS